LVGIFPAPASTNTGIVDVGKARAEKLKFTASLAVREGARGERKMTPINSPLSSNM
jgi:hypothetical protein